MVLIEQIRTDWQMGNIKQNVFFFIEYVEFMYKLVYKLPPEILRQCLD